MTSIAVRDETHWRELRSKHIGGSEVAALFNASTFLTYFELWHIKAGNIPDCYDDDDDRSFWGKKLEDSIAKGVAALKNWTIQKVHRYIIDDEVEGWGASMDYEIINHEWGPGVLEIKNVDYLVWMEWENEEPPMQYLLQLQNYMALRKCRWGAFGVLVGGNDIKIYTYFARPKIIKEIRNRIKNFWQTIKEGIEPKPDFSCDLRAIRKLYSNVSGGVLDLTGDNYLASLCADYVAASADEKAALKRKETAMAEILTKIGDAGLVLLDGFKIGSCNVAENRIEYTRGSYRMVRITEDNKGKENE